MKTLALTVSEVGTELTEIESHIRHLERRATTLRSFLAQARAVAGAVADGPRGPSGAIWAAAEETLRHAGKPLSLRAIAARLVKAGWVLKDGPEAVRLSIKHKPDRFRRVRPSVYALRSARPRQPSRRRDRRPRRQTP